MKKFIFLALIQFLVLGVVITFAMPKKSNNMGPISFQETKKTDPPAFVLLQENNVAAYFWITGVIDQNMNLQNHAGLYWPKNTGDNHTACFTAGLCLAGFVNGQLAQSMVSYKGEFTPGYIVNNQAQTSSDFKYYSVKTGDTIFNNPDYANWYKMVPYGAPFIDVNNNGIYDNGIDIPGIRNAEQTIFACLTDGFDTSHKVSEGFGGGITYPLLISEVHITGWVYNIPSLTDIQYIKWEVVNKSQNVWDKTFFSIVTDPDLGFGYDDLIGCDVNRNLGFCYNGTDYDQYYGDHPPAFGIRLLKGAVRQYQTPSPDSLKLTSFTHFTDIANSPPPCESDPDGEPYPAYRMMTGVKKDSTPYLDPTIIIGTGTRKTKFTYPGDPETNTGWTEQKGCIQNCGGDTSNASQVGTNPPGDRRFIMSSGSFNFQIAPNEKQTIVAAQMVARGVNYKNSVTLLKQLSDVASDYYFLHVIGIQKIGEVVPVKYKLYQNYPNPFNPSTVIKFDIPKSDFVTIDIYDITGKLVSSLMNEYKTSGTYEIKFDAAGLASGVYFCRMSSNAFSDVKRMVFIK